MHRPTVGRALFHFTPPKENLGESVCVLCNGMDENQGNPQCVDTGGSFSKPVLKLAAFLKTLSRFVTDLPVTYSSSEAFMIHLDAFMPVLRNVRKLSLDFNKESSQSPKHFIKVLKLIFKENTRVFSIGADLRSSRDFTHQPDFKQIWNVLHNAVVIPKHSEMDLTLQRKSGHQNNSRQETKVVLHQPSTKRAKLSVAKCAFEPLLHANCHDSIAVSGLSTDNRLSLLELNFTYNFEKNIQALSLSISLWKNLRCLILDFENNIEFDFSSVLDNLVCFGNLRELVIFSLRCQPHHEQAIINVAKPKFCPQHDKTKNRNSQLDSLSLYTCLFTKTLLEEIITEFKQCDHRRIEPVFEGNDENKKDFISNERKSEPMTETRDEVSSFCYFRGLTTFHTSMDNLKDEWDDSDMTLPSIIHRNHHLKEFRLILDFFSQSLFSALLRSLKGMYLT